MIAPPYLNTCMPYKWARVVSGETWAEYAVGTAGLVEAKTTRGPLILWATKTGEEENLPVIGGPAPSPLEVQVAHVNVCAHLQAFARAAHGKVRRSVRWKTPRKTLERRAYAIRTYRVPGKFYEGRPCLIMLGWSNKRTVPRRTARRFFKRYALRERYNEKLNALFPGSPEDRYAHGFDRDGYEHFGELVAEIIEDEYKPRNLGSVLHTAAQLGGKWCIKPILNLIRCRKPDFSAVRALRSLEAAAYRAHITQRVRPPARRTRIPRPLYARPRPPTAPLAPPVTC